MEQGIDKKGKRILELDLMRGVAIILMIVGHSILVHPIDFSKILWCQTLHNWIYSFHMEMFFFISGAVYHCSKYRTYILNKFDRLIVPMLFVGIVAVLFHSFGGSAVNEHYTFGDGIRGLLTGDAYWFLYTLFLIAAIYPLFDRIGIGIRWFEPVLAITLIVLNHFVDYPSVFKIQSVMYYLPYFIVGHILSGGLRSGKFVLPLPWQLVAIIVFVSAYALLSFAPPRLMVVRYAKAFAMIGAFYYLFQFVVSRNWKQCKALSTVNGFLCLSSRYSLQLYLFNGFVLVLARTILVSKLHITNPVIVIPLIVIANLAVTLPLCKYVLEKTKWIGWLCGVKYRPWKK